MRIAYRVLYAMVMVILFLFTLNYAQELMTSLYFENQGADVLAKDDVDYSFFYGSVPDYYLDDPQYAVNQNGYEFSIYEIAKLEETSGSEMFQPFYYIVVHSKENEMNGLYSISIKTNQINPQNEQYITYDLNLFQFRKLNLFVGVNENQSVYVNPSLFTEYQVTSITLLEGDHILSVIDTTTHAFNTRIDVELNEFYQSENRMPSETDLVDKQIYPNYTHVMEDYNYVFTLAMIIYVVILVVTTYLIFFFKRHRNHHRLSSGQKNDI